ncbi:MAG: type II toxin-antitoxin system RelE/ParE family toxin [Bacteroidota bacterium]
MGVYKLSEKCKADLVHIYEYGIDNFGLNQAQNYMLGLHELFQTLPENVNLGRDASEFFPSLKRFVYKSHMIFYLQADSGVFIVRTLSQSMDYEQHLV